MKNIASKNVEDNDLDITQIEPVTKVPRLQECNNGNSEEAASSSKEQKQKSIFS